MSSKGSRKRDEPTAKDFVRRAYHASLLLGECIYINGGEIAMLVDGEVMNIPSNDTLTIDMRTSWTNDSVSSGSISKTREAPVLNRGSLFPAPDDRSFFQFGGGVNSISGFGYDIPATSVSQFLTQGKGHGSWSKFNPGATSGFQYLTRPTRALATMLDDTFFILGGIADAKTSPETQDSLGFPLGGIVAFNMTSGKWTNSSMPSHMVRPRGKNGVLSSVPGFGPVGLLLAAGIGFTESDPPNFGNITLYEPSTKTWYYQKATGDVPAGRDLPCAVGIRGDKGTYEIFMYGGQIHENLGPLLPYQVKDNIDRDEIYVLSLPAFAWFRADYPAQNPRNLHTCHVVGNRQMLSIGGLNRLDPDSINYSKDTATHGLQIFDMTELKWTDGYNANAAPYTTPAIIKDWYQYNGTASIQWSTPDVKNFFAKSLSTETGTSLSFTPLATTPTPYTPSSSNSTNTSVIVGGIVGPLTAFGVLATFIFCFIRRRRRRKPASLEPSTTSHDIEHPSEPAEMDAQPRRVELDDGDRVWEADGVSRIEMDGNGNVRWELGCGMGVEIEMERA